MVPLTLLDTDIADHEPSLAQLAVAAVAGLSAHDARASEARVRYIMRPLGAAALVPPPAAEDLTIAAVAGNHTPGTMGFTNPREGTLKWWWLDQYGNAHQSIGLATQRDRNPLGGLPALFSPR